MAPLLLSSIAYSNFYAGTGIMTEKVHNKAVLRMGTPIENSDSLFKPGRNCEAVEVASYASILIDCATYYRALYEAINAAKHSVFVLGWDIDSRIELLRGEDAKPYGDCTTLFKLVQRKARENPDIQFFLNRWDYSVLMSIDRENFAVRHWKKHSPENVHYCLDDALPTGASHHQKVIVVDDEVVFCGGMDVALNRWDKREHYPVCEERADPGDLYHLNTHQHFGPYHDIQFVLAGPAARPFAKLVRERWRRASCGAAIPIRENAEIYEMPAAWPKSTKPEFHNVPLAMATTQPEWDDAVPSRQIEQLYLDMIGKAERFIYMENQYFSRLNVAEALNRRLREVPELRVLLVSSRDPHGKIEGMAMWHGRLKFREILESGGVGDRVALAYPISKVKDEEKCIHIHSKLMIIDDHYLRVGSSNVNNRSMALDTECDIVIEGNSEESRRQIADIRNDLIREHTGREAASIEKMVKEGISPEKFLNYITHSRQHLRRIDDEKYRRHRFTAFAMRIADPCEPLLPVAFSMKLAKIKWMKILMALLVVAGFALLWQVTPLAEYARPEKIAPLLEQVRNTPWALPAGLVLYVILMMLFFPHMVMTGVTVLAFPPGQAFFIIMAGSLISSAMGFALGEKLGLKSMHAILGEAAGKISGYAKKGGVLGITLLRLVPIAPFTAVNLALGMLEIPFMTLMVGTFLGNLPGAVVGVFLGQSALELWRNPNPKNITYLLLGVAAWVGIIVVSHLSARWWKRNKASAAPV